VKIIKKVIIAIRVQQLIKRVWTVARINLTNKKIDRTMIVLVKRNLNQVVSLILMKETILLIQKAIHYTSIIYSDLLTISFVSFTYCSKF
jgi:hypothetical protein